VKKKNVNLVLELDWGLWLPTKRRKKRAIKTGIASGRGKVKRAHHFRETTATVLEILPERGGSTGGGRRLPFLGEKGYFFVRDAGESVVGTSSEGAQGGEKISAVSHSYQSKAYL